MAAARGYTNVKVFTDGIPGWIKAGYPVDTTRAVPRVNIPTVTWDELQALGDTVTVYELTRPKARKAIGYIPGAVNIPMPELSRRVAEIPKGKPVIVVDYNGKQYQHAGSWLLANGYKDVKALSGGLIEAVRKGVKLPLEK